MMCMEKDTSLFNKQHNVSPWHSLLNFFNTLISCPDFLQVIKVKIIIPKIQLLW